MHTRFLAACTACVALGAGASAAGAKTVHLNLTFTGNSIGGNTSVYEYHGNGERGAAVQTTKFNAAITAGTDRTVTYDGFGTTVSRDKFTLGPAANGAVPITGSGKFVSGTGRYRHIKGTYTFTGTSDSTTGITTVHVTGTETY